MSQQIVYNCVKKHLITQTFPLHIKKSVCFVHQAWSRQPCPAWTGKSKRTTRSWSRLKTWPDRWAASREPRRSASPSLMSTTTRHASPRVSHTHTHTHTHTHSDQSSWKTTCQCEPVPGRQPPIWCQYQNEFGLLQGALGFCVTKAGLLKAANN